MAVERSCQEWEEKKALMQGAAAFFALLSGPVGWVAEGFCAGWALGQML